MATKRCPRCGKRELIKVHRPLTKFQHRRLRREIQNNSEVGKPIYTCLSCEYRGSGERIGK